MYAEFQMNLYSKGKYCINRLPSIVQFRYTCNDFRTDDADDIEW